MRQLNANSVLDQSKATDSVVNRAGRSGSQIASIHWIEIERPYDPRLIKDLFITIVDRSEILLNIQCPTVKWTFFFAREIT